MLKVMKYLNDTMSTHLTNTPPMSLTNTIPPAEITASVDDAIDKQLRLLQNVRASLSPTLEPDEFFKVVSHSLHQVFGYPIVGIYMFENGELILRHAIGLQPNGAVTPVAHCVVTHVSTTGEPLWLPEKQQTAEDSTSESKESLQKGTNSEIAVPLFVVGKVAGVLTIESYDSQRLTRNDFTLMQTLGEYVSFGLEQMRLFEQLRKSEHRARALLDTVPDLMFVHARDGTYLDFHTTRFDRPKVPLESALGKRIRDIFGLEYEQKILPVFEKTLDTGEVQTFEYNFEESDGERHYFEARIIAYEPDKVLSLVRDITKEKQIEQLQQQRLLELEEASRAKDEFLATMSHELRTPLHSILTLNESLREEIYGPISKNQSNILSSMEKSGRHLLALINDILDIAKIEAGKLHLDIQRMFVRQAIQTSLEIVQDAATRKNIHIAQSIDSSIIYLNADERRLVQILVNLLSNAVKFTPDGGSVGIEVAGDIERKLIRFIVWDTGIGISQENREKLFKPFVQLDSSLSRQFEGTGLGLALVRRLAEMHGGGVNVESTLNKGSRFTVYLPWVGANLMPDPGTHRRASNTATHTIMHSNIPNKWKPEQTDGPIVLIAEDNPTSQEAIGAYLTAHSYQVVLANNGAEAVLQAATYLPDLILMDIQMPEVDGIQATKQIRRNESLAHVPIVALTALAMPGDRERCLAAGVNEYLSKPVSLRHLIKVIETQLTKGKLLPLH